MRSGCAAANVETLRTAEGRVTRECDIFKGVLLVRPVVDECTVAADARARNHKRFRAEIQNVLQSLCTRHVRHLLL